MIDILLDAIGGDCATKPDTVQAAKVARWWTQSQAVTPELRRYLYWNDQGVLTLDVPTHTQISGVVRVTAHGSATTLTRDWPAAP